MRETRMNAARCCHLLSLGVAPVQFAKGIDTEEVDGSNPFGPTIQPIEIAALLAAIFPGISPTRHHLRHILDSHSLMFGHREG